MLDDELAHRVLALPTEYSSTRVSQLLMRGFEAWQDDGQARTKDLILAVEQFGQTALREQTRQQAAQDPPVDDPGELAVVATLAAIVVENHDRFDGDRRERIQPYAHIRELFVECVLPLVGEYNDLAIQQDIAERVYGKDYGHEPFPGRVCTGIVRKPEYSGGLYAEIPMPAASRKCLVSDDEADAAFETRIADNHLYVPVDDLTRRYQDLAEQGFDRLVDVHQDTLTDTQREWLQSQESALTDLIDRYDRTGQYEQLWTTWEPGNKLVDTVRNAVEAAPVEVAQFGEYHDPKTLYTLLVEYDPDTDWEEAIQQRVTSPSTLGVRLAEHRDHSKLDVDTSGQTNQYKLAASNTDATALPVEEIENLFELPCLANMEQHLHEEGPTRKDLYSFARLVWWLPQYHASPRETIIEDLKDVFERWPWYDEQETDYQLRYELNPSNTPDDNPDRDWWPRSCDSDDMQRYCVGKENCPYTIYSSLPFADELYDQLDAADDSPPA